MKLLKMKLLISLALIGFLFIAACTPKSGSFQDISSEAALEKIYNLDPQRKYIGVEVEDFHFKDIISEKFFHFNEDLKGEVVVVETFSVGCPSCAEGIRGYNELYDKHGDKIKIVYLNINPKDTVADILKIKKEFNGRDWIWTTYQPSLLPIYEQFGLYGNEQTLIIDREGIVSYADSFKVPISRIENALGDVI